MESLGPRDALMLNPEKNGLSVLQMNVDFCVVDAMTEAMLIRDFEWRDSEAFVMSTRTGEVTADVTYPIAGNSEPIELIQRGRRILHKLDRVVGFCPVRNSWIDMSEL